MTRDWIEVPLSISNKIGQWCLWAGSRLLVAAPALIFECGYQLSRLSMHLFDMARQSYAKVLIVYDALPYGGMAGSQVIDVSSRIPTGNTVAIEPATDIIALLEGKHALLIGGTGSGKTTLAMYLAYSIGGHIKVYDADAAVDEWVGLECIGREGNFAAIQSGMKADLTELQERMVLRGQKGDAAITDYRVYIAEEFPLLVDEIECAATWLIKHAKRGRRVKQFVIAIAQNDTVKNFGFEGDRGVMDCFRMIRLGSKAVKFAQRLKNDALVQWLRSDKSHCLVDDIPVKLPNYREMKAVTQRLGNFSQPVTGQLARFDDAVTGQYGNGYVPVTVPVCAQPNFVSEISGELPPLSGFQPPEPPPNAVIEGSLIAQKALKTLLDNGFSESRLIKEVLGYQGERYQQGRELLDGIKQQWAKADS